MVKSGQAAPASLWRHPDFLKLWAAQSVSSLGARITREGLAFTAVASLGATPAQIGVLAALVRGPAIVVGLTGGGLVDRSRRRPILIGSDIVRALVLASMPIAAWLHVLAMSQIYLVAALVGALGVLFDIADHAYLPSLIGRDRLVEGNSRLATTEALAEIGGPALYGVLFQVLTAPIAIAVNAGAYLFSAGMLGAIGAPEERHPAHASGPKGHLVGDFRAGLAAAFAQPSVATLLAMATAAAFFGAFFSALYIVYALRDLRLSAGMLGATVAVGGAAAMVGAGLAGPAIRRFGLGPAFVVTGALAAAGSFFIPLAHGAPWLGMLTLMAGQVVGDSLGTVTEIAARSLRQSLVEPSLMGRVGGVFAMAPGLTGMAGALLGGWMGSALGVRPTLFIACAGLTLAAAAGFASPLMRARAGDPLPP